MDNVKPIWIRAGDAAPNRYLLFRRRFTVTRPIAAARLRVSAHTHYLAALDGSELGRGPDPSSVNRYYVDTYAVGDSLGAGEHVLAFLAYTFGPKLSAHEAAYAPDEQGWLRFELACEYEDGQLDRVVSDSETRAAVAEAWTPDTTTYCELRTCFREYYDGAKLGYDGLATDCDDSAWPRAAVLEPGDLTHAYRFVEKEIRPFHVSRRSPVNAYALDWGTSYGFSPDRRWQVENPQALVNGYPLAEYYASLRQGEPNFPRQRLDAGDVPQCRVKACEGSGAPSIILDFGELRYGTFELELDTDIAGSVVDIAYGESLETTYVDRYTSATGPQRFRTFHVRVARYVVLTYSGVEAPIQVRSACFRQMDYPVAAEGTFASSSESLNRIVSVSRRTLHMNMHSHFEDCPSREQKLYAADSYPEALACYYSFGAWDYVRKCLVQLAAMPRTGPWLADAGPAFADEAYHIVEFPIYCILWLRDYGLFSGDLALIEELYPRMLAQIEAFRPQVKDGLIDVGEADTFDTWCFINWGDVEKRGLSAPATFMYARGLEAVADMARWLNRDKDHAALTDTLAKVRAGAQATFWSAAEGVYIDNVYRGAPSAHRSAETNALAILSGTADAGQMASILNAFGNGTLPRYTPTAFFNTFIVEVLLRGRRTREALDMLDDYWGEMIRRGADTFWEFFIRESPVGSLPPRFSSLCHGWGSSPLWLLGAYVLGIRPLEPGLARFTVDPQCEELDSFSGTVPTPHGSIICTYDQGKLHVRHPAALTPEVLSEIRVCELEEFFV